MKRTIAIVITIVFFGSSMSHPAVASLKPGTSCKNLGQTSIISGKKYTCIKSGKKLVWNRGVIIKSPTPTSFPSSSSAYKLTDKNKFQAMKTCEISSTLESPLHLGFPRPYGSIASTGNLRAISLFVFFDDLPFEQKQIDEWRNNQIPTFERFAQKMSYGKLNFQIDILDKPLHIKKSVLSYNLDTPHGAPQKPNADIEGLIRDAVAVADPLVDFTQYAFVNVVTASTKKIGLEGAWLTPAAVADGVQIKRATFGPIRQYVDDPNQKIWLLHEVGHLWGLIHPTNLDSNQPDQRATPKFSAMTMGNSPAPDFLAWERFVLNWLSENQVACISNPTEPEMTIKLTEISSESSGIKMIAIRLSEHETIVLESRRKGKDSLIFKEEEGIFAYYVDANIPTDGGAIKVIYKDNIQATEFFPNKLAKGDKATFRNFGIEILEADTSGEIVKITING
jgi:M6 family metalloprotease-like protein